MKSLRKRIATIGACSILAACSFENLKPVAASDDSIHREEAAPTIPRDESAASKSEDAITANTNTYAAGAVQSTSTTVDEPHADPVIGEPVAKTETGDKPAETPAWPVPGRTEPECELLKERSPYGIACFTQSPPVAIDFKWNGQSISCQFPSDCDAYRDLQGPCKFRPVVGTMIVCTDEVLAELRKN